MNGLDGGWYSLQVVHWLVRVGSVGVGLGPGAMGRLGSEWRSVGNGEHSPGLPQTEKLSRKHTDRSL